MSQIRPIFVFSDCCGGYRRPGLLCTYRVTLHKSWNFVKLPITFDWWHVTYNSWHFLVAKGVANFMLHQHNSKLICSMVYCLVSKICYFWASQTAANFQSKTMLILNKEG